MKRIIAIFAMLLVSVAATDGRAFEVERGQGLKDKVVGGYWSNGLGLVAGDGYEDWRNLDRDDRTPIYAPGGGLYFDFYLLNIMAIEAGLGFMSSGIRFKWDENRAKQRVVYMEIPVMVKIDIQHFQAAAGFALFVGLAGKSVLKDDNTELEEKWNDAEWEYARRPNVGPKLVIGYAIPVGPIYIVPGMSWMMHLVNDLDNDRIAEDTLDPNDETDYQMRVMNLMFNVGVEWAF